MEVFVYSKNYFFQIWRNNIQEKGPWGDSQLSNVVKSKCKQKLYIDNSL